MFNKILKFTQKKTGYLYNNSLFLQNIDKLIFASIMLVFLTSTVMSSDVIGFIAMYVKVLKKPFKLKWNNVEPARLTITNIK